MSGYDGIHFKEMRGFMSVLRRRVKDQSGWGQRFLVLGDNLGLMCSLSKGRCQSPKLLMLMGRTSALLLATGCRVYGRWLASEVNPSDELSRLRERRSAAGPSQIGPAFKLSSATRAGAEDKANESAKFEKERGSSEAPHCQAV